MTIISLNDDGTDVPESHCSSCDSRFNLIWNRNPVYPQPEYCPFCGEEIEEIVDERNPDEA